MNTYSEAVNEACLLVQATEAAGGVDDFVFLLEGFSGHGLINVIKGLLDLIGISIAIQHEPLTNSEPSPQL